jgi:hypothetical protein
MSARCNGRKYCSSRRRLPRSCHHPVAPATRWPYTGPNRARATLISSTVICAFRILQSSTTTSLPSVRPHLSRIHIGHTPPPTLPHRRLTPCIMTLSLLLRHLPTWLSSRYACTTLTSPNLVIISPDLTFFGHVVVPIAHAAHLYLTHYRVRVTASSSSALTILSFPPHQPHHHACVTQTLPTVVRPTSLSMVASSSPLPTRLSSINQIVWHIKC